MVLRPIIKLPVKLKGMASIAGPRNLEILSILTRSWSEIHVYVANETYNLLTILI